MIDSNQNRWNQQNTWLKTEKEKVSKNQATNKRIKVPKKSLNMVIRKLIPSSLQNSRWMSNFFYSFYILSYFVKCKTLPYVCEFCSIQMIPKVVACTAIKRNDVRKILMMGRKKEAPAAIFFPHFTIINIPKRRLMHAVLPTIWGMESLAWVNLKSDALLQRILCIYRFWCYMILWILCWKWIHE